jgi:hypothetical protein
MLEHAVLLLAPPKGSNRAILAPDGAPLGSARWRPRKGPWWRLRPAVLAVHEHEDEPLLFTVRRRWPLLPWREVRDAEGRRVGYLFGARISDRLGRRLARAQTILATGAREIRHRDGRALAELEASPEGVRLTFAPVVEHDPFAKMLLVAAALTLPVPARYDGG